MDCIEKIWNGKPSKEFDFLVDYNEQNHTYSIKCSEQEKLFFKLKTAFDSHACLVGQRQYFSNVNDLSTEDQIIELRNKAKNKYSNLRLKLIQSLELTLDDYSLIDLQQAIRYCILQSGLFYIKLITQARDNQEIVNIIFEYDLYEEQDNENNNEPTELELENYHQELDENFESGISYLNRVQEYLALVSCRKEIEIYESKLQEEDSTAHSSTVSESEDRNKKDSTLTPTDIAKIKFIRSSLGDEKILDLSYKDLAIEYNSDVSSKKISEEYNKIKGLEGLKDKLLKGYNRQSKIEMLLPYLEDLKDAFTWINEILAAKSNRKTY